MVRQIQKYFTETLLVPLSRAYWSKVSQRLHRAETKKSRFAWHILIPDLGESYEQVAMDLQDGERLTYRGPAAELREILTGCVHRLAPTADVEVTDWYKEARRSGKRNQPTLPRAERTKFILRSRMKGHAADETAETFAESVEERLASLVNATYKRGKRRDPCRN